ncbi:hypothetical protein [Paenibacillus hemerocallicola]|uniref:hypothetical protein n=1 Tax=Paenibacillus hemerocallicola TaxID=1172614 RepID=UPI00159ECC08|nr:hypothetical protein [Paenibacillus hemerocallicola]
MTKSMYVLSLLTAAAITATACGSGTSTGSTAKEEGKAVSQTPDTQKPGELSF